MREEEKAEQSLWLKGAWTSSDGVAGAVAKTSAGLFLIIIEDTVKRGGVNNARAGAKHCVRTCRRHSSCRESIPELTV